MKALFNKQKSTTVLIGILATVSIMAQDLTKEIKKEFPVNANTRFELYNKYGNVDVVNNDNAILSIKVLIKADGRDQENAKRILEMINVNITQEGDVIKAVTDIDEDFGKYFKNFHNDNNNLQINFSISLPKTLPVYLSNKYGNVFINELVSTSTIDVKYGKLTANKILHDSKEPLTKIYLSYSNGSIQETKWIEADIKYSKLNITESKALAIISKYSKVSITNGSSVVSESKYDTYEIEKLVNFVTTASYGHFNIGRLSGKLQVETKYTDVIVDYISAEFDGIKVDNSYGSFKLGIDGSASYRINGYAKYCNITYPENNAKVSRFNENNEMKINGIVGSGGSPKAEVTVTSHYGNIRLIQ
jgi:hypothetical protein